MHQDVTGNTWTWRRTPDGELQLFGWDIDHEKLVDDWVTATPGDVVNLCHAIDGALLLDSE